MKNQKVSNKEFCDTLRDVGEKLASGERDEVLIPKSYIDMHVEGGDKITPSYIRMTINRVGSVKAKGSASVKVRANEEGAKSFVITIKTDAKRKVITNDDMPRLEATWRKKFIKHLLATQPRITDLKGEQLEGAAIALERFMAMIEKMGEDE